MSKIYHVAAVLFALGFATPTYASMSGEVEQVVDQGLDWLASKQQRLGHWTAQGRYPAAMTSLAGLAMLCEGSTTTEGPYADNVRRAVDYLISQSRPNGLIGDPLRDDRYTYGHGFALLFLSQVLGEEEDAQRREELVRVLTKGVRFKGQAQTDAGGWGYVSAKDGNGFDEGSTTITQVQGLRGCRNAGIPVPKEVVDKAVDYIKKCTLRDGGVQYSSKGGGGRPAITAAAIACLFNAGEYDDDYVPRMLKYCRQHLDQGRQNNYGHWHYAHFYYAQVEYREGGEIWDAYRDTTYSKLILRVGASRPATRQRSDVEPGLCRQRLYNIAQFDHPADGPCSIADLPALATLACKQDKVGLSRERLGLVSKDYLQIYKRTQLCLIPLLMPTVLQSTNSTRLRIAFAEQLAQVIVGQHSVIDQLLVTLFCRGHCLLEGVPGLAKTLLISTLAKSLNLSFSRIQFTPDLMPADITGTDIIEENKSTGQRDIRFLPGPIFSHVILADEINRTPPKTQAALLEAMQERQSNRWSGAARNRRPVLRARHAKPHRAGRHLPAARGATRSIHAEDIGEVSLRGRRTGNRPAAPPVPRKRTSSRCSRLRKSWKCNTWYDSCR